MAAVVSLSHRYLNMNFPFRWRRFVLVLSAALILTGLILTQFPHPSLVSEPPSDSVAVLAGGGHSVVASTGSNGVGAALPGLPPLHRAGNFWEASPSEAPFAAFAGWARRFQDVAPAGRSALESEGVTLALARLTALANLIQANPERALALAVPASLRAILPESIRSVSEESINARGGYDLICVTPLPGADPLPMVRAARIAEQTHQVFTFGAALDYVTRQDVPLNGIAVPVSAATAPPTDLIGLRPAKLLALNPNPARLLEVEESAVRAAGAPVAVEYGGEVRTFAALPEAEAWVNEQVTAANLSSPATPPTAESPRTEGRKRMLCLRPYWTDYTTMMTTNDALTHWVNFSNFMSQMSYGKMVFAPLGEGSDITPDMLMPGLVADYDDQGLSKLYPTAVDVARTNYGYNTSQYDYLYVCTRGKPAAGYAGLAWVGGVGFHLANSYFQNTVAGHEFGHNLGLNHAHFWDTDGKSVIGDGQNVEYGDDTDPMGNTYVDEGKAEFGSRYKNYLNWIPGADIVDLNTAGSGRYRLYSFDLDYATNGIRGLKATRNGSQNYWIQFRQRLNSRNSMMNGVQILWTGNNNEGSYHLDVRNKDDSLDNGLVIGRTFSDTNVNLHITPVAKAHTYPEAMDVVVFRGTFPTNKPPAVLVSASATNAATGATITFAAAATDPNGDELAFYWEGSDGSYSSDNQPIFTRSFASAGDYRVNCAVSDMRGGVARGYVVVRVGSPTTFTIRGRVLTTNGAPLAGIRVFSATGVAARTDSDGTYTLTGLAAGNYTLDALEPVFNATAFAHPFFINPLVVSSSLDGVDFVAMSGAAQSYAPIVAKNSTWRYLDNGSDQGTAWRAPIFDDSTWTNGAGILGYGEGNETTIVSYGPSATAKYATTYFRRAFNVADPAALTNLLLEVLRDDGVVVYLNGTEVFRDNMPAGAPLYSTYTGDAIEPGNYLATNLSPSLLVAGNNVLAAEVHQADGGSSDLNFDLALSGLSATNVVSAAVVYLTSPANHQILVGPTNLVITATARSAVAAVTNVEFIANGTLIVADVSPSYAANWSAGLGMHTLSAVAAFDNGRRQTSAPVSLQIIAPPTPAVAISLVATGSVWRYLAGPTSAPSAWTGLTFNDTAWLAGPAEFGYGENDEATVVPFGGVAASKWVTTYFRHRFIAGDPASITNLQLRLKRDDGAIVSLNGVEVVRDLLPAGAIAWSTLATNAADDGKNFNSFNLDPARLVPGTNVLAVEVHQSALDTSDLSFDLALDGLASTNRSRGLWLVAPTNNAVVDLPGNVTLTAEVVAGGTLGVARVEFFSGTTKIGEALNAPFTAVWTNPPPGVQIISAVTTDTDGDAVNSGPVSILVKTPPLGTQFISFGDVWRYLDDGTNLGLGWTARNFNDRLWRLGATKFGYGGDGEITTISYGPNPNARYITTYFRKAFTVAVPSAYTGLRLRLVRDDAAVVYLNGVEVYRNNLLPGLVSFNSLALTTLNAPDETAVLDVLLGATNLVAGTNVVAVELHQAAVNSSDAGMNLALIGTVATNTAQGVYLTSPADGAHFNLPASVALSASAVASGASVSRVEYFADATKVGESSVQPFNATWSGASQGTHSLTAVATYGANQFMTSAPITIVVGTAPPPITPVSQPLISVESGWRFWDSLASPGPVWQLPDFHDSSWLAGTARFGWGLDGENTTLTEGRITQYFRRWFNVADPSLLTELVFGLVRDDGAVVYLNGREVFRQNMPAGTVTPTTLAGATINPPEETMWFEAALATHGSGLLTGSNLVAVEVHQSSATSSDAGFDLQLQGHGTTEPRVYLSSPRLNATYFIPAEVEIDAQVRAAAGASVTRVEFFANSSKIGEATSAPWQSVWSNPAIGSYAITAVATDNSGRTMASEALPISVGLQTVTLSLIPTGAVWNYLDNGSNQDTNWAQRSYNDSAWFSGPGELGYGDASDGRPEATVVASGPLSSRFITTYFRHQFVVPPNVVITNLEYHLVFDDGAVVWLNGSEQYRSNLPPAGVIAYNTTATTSISGAAEATYFTTIRPTTSVAPGTNLVAVEIHQQSGRSSDISFDLELIGRGYINVPPAPALLVEQDGQFLRLSWPADATGYDLESTDALPPAGVWQPYNALVTESGGRKMVTVVPSLSVQYFRLTHP